MKLSCTSTYYSKHSIPPRTLHCLYKDLISQKSENLDITVSCPQYDYIMFTYKHANISMSRSCECKQYALKPVVMFFFVR